MATTNEAMIWTCRLALAVAEQDQAEIAAVVDEVTAAGPEAPPLLLTTMAGTIASLMAERAGANWRVALEQTLAAVRGS